MTTNFENLGIDQNTYKKTNNKDLLKIFEKMSYCREFENNVIKYHNRGLIKIINLEEYITLILQIDI